MWVEINHRCPAVVVKAVSACTGSKPGSFGYTINCNSTEHYSCRASIGYFPCHMRLTGREHWGFGCAWF